LKQNFPRRDRTWDQSVNSRPLWGTH